MNEIIYLGISMLLGFVLGRVIGAILNWRWNKVVAANRITKNLRKKYSSQNK